ncbi:DUF3987 domain-containing protein [Duganella sp. FT3S]|uniref:DUF3987 domain-containing protein n=1 Tax=Rugamonas fusca TaxID=2758568 RepID=A0A7W2I6E6_9BURK|nr:YfjI family protein [Rugamonas fusca]MBA5605387.1 DUF3987 domain-containing protein [Rugamonas fusca]
MKNFQIRRFPIEHIPESIKNPILETYANIQAPIPLVFASALGAISLACQRSINVQRPNGLISPCSLYLLTIAESGERKSTVDKIFRKPITEFERKRTAIFSSQIIHYEAMLSAWNVEKKAILSSIKKCTIKGESCDQLKEQLIEHNLLAPERPKSWKMIYTDATPEAIKRGLFESNGSAGIISDEAGDILFGRALTDLSAINSLWSGDAYQVDRVGSSSYSVSDPRLTLSLMIQPNPLRNYLGKSDTIARSIGFLARFLVAFPQSTQGERFIEDRTHSWTCVSEFHDRLESILEQSVSNECPQTLRFCHAAKERWIEVQNEVELDLGKGRFLSDIKDFASKLSENIARLAAIFHTFEEKSGPISLETLNQAVEIGVWYAFEFKRLFSDEGRNFLNDDHSTKLENWLFDLSIKTSSLHIQKNYIRQYAPYSLRNKRILDSALNDLVQDGKVCINTFGKMSYVYLNKAHFANSIEDWPDRGF